MVRTIIILLINIFIFSSIGCNSISRALKGNIQRSKKSINFFIDSNEKVNISRVLVMPIKDISSNKNEIVINKVYDSITYCISTKNYFEVVKFDELESKFINKIQRSFFSGESEISGKVDVSKELKEKYAIDAVLFPTIKSYRSYKPISFGYKQYLISTATGNVIWVIDDILNMAERNINALAKNWYYKNHTDEINPSLNDEIMDISFDNFLKFSFNLFVETWEK